MSPARKADDRHRQLRDLIGVGDSLSLDAKSPDDAARRKTRATLFMTRIMLTAMENCKVSVAVLQ